MPTFHEQLASYLVDLTALEQPLAAGLRALAEDPSAQQHAAGLQALAGELEQGKTLLAAIDAVQDRLPGQFPPLLRAGLESGQVGEALQDFVAQQRRLTDLKYDVRRALAYPLLVTMLLLPVMLVYVFYLVPAVNEYAGELGDITETLIESPDSTSFFTWLGDKGFAWLAAVVAVVVAAFLAVRFIGGRGAWHRLRNSLPLFGPLFTYIGLAEFCHSLASLVERRLPLHAAIRITANGLSDDGLAASCDTLAEELEAGFSFPEALAASSAFPPTLVTLASWGADCDRLGRGLAIAADEFAERAQLQSDYLSSLLPTILFFFTAGTLMLLVNNAFVAVSQTLRWLIF